MPLIPVLLIELLLDVFGSVLYKKGSKEMFSISSTEGEGGRVDRQLRTRNTYSVY